MTYMVCQKKKKIQSGILITNKMTIKLSPSKLNLFLECSLCFWLNEQGIHRPSGPFPSLPGGMDRKLKIYFDRYRTEGKLQ